MTGTTATGSVSPVRQLVAGGVGHTIQWYDFIAYSYLAIFFADQIFPQTSDDDLVPLLATYGVFAVGFLMRPIGGLVLGPFADRFGRRATLQVTIVLMAVGSLLIAVLPTYDQVGVLAPVILILARLIQSFAEGGEFATGSVFLAEAATQGRRGFYSSFMFVGSGVAKILTLGLVAVLTGVLDARSMEEFGWRIPFAIGALAAVWGWWLRRGAAETLDVEPGAERPARRRAFEALDAFRAHPGKSLQVFALTIGISLHAYFWSVYFPIFAGISGGLEVQRTQFIGLIGLVFYTALIPLIGFLSDRVGRKPILYVFGVGTAVLTVPLLSGIGTSNFTSALLAQLAGLAVLACGTSVQGAVFAEMFPAQVRVTGMAFPYNLAVTVFGGTVAAIGTALVSIGQPQWFGVYLAAGSVITLIATVSLRETRAEEI